MKKQNESGCSGLVSIVIPVYNAAAYIQNTIENIIAQTYHEWEIILVDDCSKDNGAQVIENYINEHKNKTVNQVQIDENRIKLIRQTKNRGAAEARNAGVQVATGRYIAFLDADDIWLPRKLESQINFMTLHNAAFSCTSYEFGDEKARPTGKIVRVEPQLTYKQALTKTIIFTSTVMFDMGKLTKEQIHMPDCKSEDTATWWQILRSGIRVYGLYEALAIYRRPASSLSSNKLEAIRRIWNLYRQRENLGLLKSFICLIGWAFNATGRRSFKNSYIAVSERPQKREILGGLTSMLVVVGIFIETLFYSKVWFTQYYPLVRLKLKFYFKGHLLVFLIYFFMLLLFMKAFDGMQVGFRKALDIVLSQIMAVAMTNLLIYFQISLMRNWIIPVWPILVLSAVQFIFVAIWVNLLTIFYKRIYPPNNLRVICGSKRPREMLEKLESRPDLFCVQEVISQEKDSIPVARKYDSVFLSGVSEQKRNEIIKYCYAHGIRIYMKADIPDELIYHSKELNLFDTPVYMVREYALTFGQRQFKRFCDVLFSLLLIIILSPLLLAAAIISKCSYPHDSVFTRQTRLTKGEKRFPLYKFRTDSNGKITTAAKFLRRSHINELPQLLNILQGDMSFIGPRAETEQQYAEGCAEIPEYTKRLSVKAGVIGTAQLYGKYDSLRRDKFLLDLSYIQDYSISLDFKMGLLVFKYLLMPEELNSDDGV